MMLALEDAWHGLVNPPLRPAGPHLGRGLFCKYYSRVKPAPVRLLRLYPPPLSKTSHFKGELKMRNKTASWPPLKDTRHKAQASNTGRNYAGVGGCFCGCFSIICRVLPVGFYQISQLPRWNGFNSFPALKAKRCSVKSSRGERCRVFTGLETDEQH